jgi:hypothetical protein
MTQVIRKGGFGGLVWSGGGYSWHYNELVVAKFKTHDKAKAYAKKLRKHSTSDFTYVVKKVK